MTEDGRKVSVRIFGCDYPLKKKGKESEYYEKVAGIVDQKMSKIAEESSLISMDKIAVLAALRISEDFVKLKQASGEKEKRVRSRLKDMSELLKSVLR